MTRLRVAACVALLAIGLRFYQLGTWSFAGDELATIHETRVLFEGAAADPDNQRAKLPRLLPAGYAVQYVGYWLFSATEFGSRVPAAVLGSILPLVLVLLLWRPLGGWAATATGLLVAIWPEAVFQSQQNRFYMTAGLVAGACAATAAAAVEARHRGAFAVACGLALVGPFFHPILAALAAGLAAAVWAGMPLGDDGRRRHFLRMAGATGLVVGGVVAAYHLPLVWGWNAGATWGYNVPQAFLGGVKRLGVPTILLAGVGMILMIQTRHRARWFWAVWVGGWAATLVVLPPVLAYHPAYSFPFAFAPFVLAGYAVGEVARMLAAQTGRASAVAWVAAVCLLNLPALVSHYADGSRHDYRMAAEFVASARQPGDKVVAISPTNLAHYEKSLADAAALDSEQLADELSAIERRGQPTWLILPTGRQGREPAAQAWLNRHGHLERTYRKQRLDYDEYTLDVYKFDGRP